MDRGGLSKPNPEAPFLEIEHRAGVQFRDIVLTRPEGKQTTAIEAINARDCQDLVLDNVTVKNHRTRSGVLYLLNCKNATIRNCTITNYMRIAVDDRTASPRLGLRLSLYRRQRHRRQRQYGHTDSGQPDYRKRIATHSRGTGEI